MGILTLDDSITVEFLESKGFCKSWDGTYRKEYREKLFKGLTYLRYLRYTFIYLPKDNDKNLKILDTKKHWEDQEKYHIETEGDLLSIFMLLNVTE